jgi:mannose-6-phosphate isomerase-like protein (cupin superfamily)
VTEPLATYALHDGSEYRVIERPDGPGDRLVMEFHLQPGAGVPPPHVHPHAAETFEAVQGEFELSVDGEPRTLRPGESATVPAGVPHTFRSPTSPVVVHNVHDPHCDFESFIRSVAQLSRDHETAAVAGPGMAARMAVIWGRHGDLIQPADLPMKVAFPVLRVGAAVARLDVPR